jgi:hypothetical protein
MTYKQIADRYGLHFNTVIKRLGLKPTRRTPYRRPDAPRYHTL